MNNIIELKNITTFKDLPVDTILDKAKENLDKEEHVLIIGHDKDGVLYEASSTSDLKELIFLLEKCKMNMMNRTNGEVIND